MFAKLIALLNKFFFGEKVKLTFYVEENDLDNNLIQLELSGQQQPRLVLSSGYSLEDAIVLTTESLSYMLEDDLVGDAPVFKPGYSLLDYQERYRSLLNEHLVLMRVTVRKLSQEEQKRLLNISNTRTKVDGTAN